MSLPAESNAQVEVHLLNGGSMLATTKSIHKDVEVDESFRLYDWAFHIYEPESKRHLLWDVGISNVEDDYVPSIQKIMTAMSCVGPKRTLVEQLESNDVRAEAIDSVIFSYAHFDHCRPIAREFRNAIGYFGPDTKIECAAKLEFHNNDPSIGHKFDPRFFDSETCTEEWQELSGPWIPFAGFDKAMDFFGNGSLWIIQAPGHMPGNLCAAARVSGGRWVLLGSDCAHTKALLDGKYDIAEVTQADGTTWSLHDDPCLARQTMGNIRHLEHQSGFNIALAHDSSWMLSEVKNPVLFSLLDEKLQLATVKYVAEQKAFEIRVGKRMAYS